MHNLTKWNEWSGNWFIKHTLPLCEVTYRPRWLIAPLWYGIFCSWHSEMFQSCCCKCKDTKGIANQFRKSGWSVNNSSAASCSESNRSIFYSSDVSRFVKWFFKAGSWWLNRALIAAIALRQICLSIDQNYGRCSDLAVVMLLAKSNFVHFFFFLTSFGRC